MHHFRNPRHRQRGAALVVALILLIVVSVMAISSMNTATLDLMMAGNEQFRSRAFAAAESGIEDAWHNGEYDSSKDFTPPEKSVGVGADKYIYKITRPGKGAVESSPPGNSEGTFGAVYFKIESSGTSERNSTALTNQELFQVVRSPGEPSYRKDACAGTSSLDAAASSC